MLPNRERAQLPRSIYYVDPYKSAKSVLRAVTDQPVAVTHVEIILVTKS